MTLTSVCQKDAIILISDETCCSQGHQWLLHNLQHLLTKRITFDRFHGGKITAVKRILISLRLSGASGGGSPASQARLSSFLSTHFLGIL